MRNFILSSLKFKASVKVRIHLSLYIVYIFVWASPERPKRL